jgi:hypothetical protein
MVLSPVFDGHEVRMRVAALCFALVVQGIAHGSEPLARLQARVSVTPIVGSPITLAGRYTSASDELARYWGGGHLSGEDLHLFPDGTYLYCEWADVEPMTVYDKGSWHVQGSTLELASDPDIVWAPNAERRYVAVQRSGRRNDAILVGVERALPTIESETKEDPGFALLLAGLLRAERYSGAKAVQAKARLMRTAWRPDYFRLGK